MTSSTNTFDIFHFDIPTIPMPQPRVFLDFTVGDAPLGRVVVSFSTTPLTPARAVLRCVSCGRITNDSVPKTAEKWV